MGYMPTDGAVYIESTMAWTKSTDINHASTTCASDAIHDTGIRPRFFNALASDSYSYFFAKSSEKATD